MFIQHRRNKPRPRPKPFQHYSITPQALCNPFYRGLESFLCQPPSYQSRQFFIDVFLILFLSTTPFVTVFRVHPQSSFVYLFIGRFAFSAVYARDRIWRGFVRWLCCYVAHLVRPSHKGSVLPNHTRSGPYSNHKRFSQRSNPGPR